MTLLRPLLHVATLLAVVSMATLAPAKTFLRGPRAYQRDLKKLRTAARITSMNDLFKGKLSFTRSRLPKAGATWRSLAQGEKRFSVDLGNGCTVKGEAYRIDLPMVSVTKLKKLSLVQGGRSTSVLPRSKVPILLDHSTDFWYADNKKVTWNGPESRYAVLALFHELGHVKDFKNMTEAQRQEFKTIYDLKSNRVTLTKEQQRKMVGFERSAWAHALRQARQLRRKGFDMLKGSSNAEVMKIVYGALRSYYDYKGTRDTMPEATPGWPPR